jgi:xanthine dehydrogenase accessory factor
LIDHTQSIIDTSMGKCYIRQIRNISRVFVFGGGHLAQELVPLLITWNFDALSRMDRAEFSVPMLFPDAEKVYTLDYDNLKTTLGRASRKITSL